MSGFVRGVVLFSAGIVVGLVVLVRAGPEPEPRNRRPQSCRPQRAESQ